MDFYRFLNVTKIPPKQNSCLTDRETRSKSPENGIFGDDSGVYRGEVKASQVATQETAEEALLRKRAIQGRTRKQLLWFSPRNRR